MTTIVNWDRVLALKWGAAKRGGDEASFWDERAEDFAYGHARRETAGLSDVITGFVRPAPGETALDLGAGAGALTLPLARVARRVTALDLSGEMLARLSARAAGEGLNNLRTVRGRFRDLADRRIGRHDIVTACRALPLLAAGRDGDFDPAGTLRRMDALARSRVYILAGTHSFALDPDFLALFTPEERRGFRRGDLSTFNLAHTLGFMPRLDYLAHPVAHAYDDPEEAFELQSRAIGLAPAHRARFLHYFRRKGRRAGGEWHLDLPGRTPCIWWRKRESFTVGLEDGGRARVKSGTKG